jgi:hypothetical protein
MYDTVEKGEQVMQRFRGLLEEYKQADKKRRLDMWLMFREMRVLFDEVERRTTECPLLNLNEFLSFKCRRGRDKKIHDEVSRLKNVFQLEEPVWETPTLIHRRSAMAKVWILQPALLNKLKNN